MFEKMGIMAYLMAEAYDAQINGNPGAAICIMDGIHDAVMGMGNAHIESLYDCVGNAIGWVDYCQRSKAS